MVLPLGHLFQISSQMFNGQKSTMICTAVTISVKQELTFNESPKNMVGFNYLVLSFLIFVHLQETTGEKSFNKSAIAEEVTR